MVEVEGEAALGRMVVPQGLTALCWQQEQIFRTVGPLLSGLGRLGTVGQGDLSLWPSRKSQPLGESVVQNKMCLSQPRHL